MRGVTAAAEEKLSKFGYSYSAAASVPPAIVPREDGVHVLSDVEKDGTNVYAVAYRDRVVPPGEERKEDGVSSSSLSSPGALTPSMAKLLGKYASNSHSRGKENCNNTMDSIMASQDGVGSIGLNEGRKGRVSPVFERASNEQKRQIEAINARGSDSEALDREFERHFAAAEAMVSSVSKTVASKPELFDSIQKKYPLIASSLVQSAVDGQTETNVEHIDQVPENLLSKYSNAMEENTIELKSQVIFHRVDGLHQRRDRMLESTVIDLDDLPDAENNVHREKELPTIDGLEKAISRVLAKNENKVTHTPALHATNTLGISTGSATSLSRRKSVSTPSLPTTVPPFENIDESAYSSLPSFIKGQLSLDILNEASASVHSLVKERHSSGLGVGFSSDDIESISPLPSGKSKVLLNALAKLNIVNLKVVYGQGTVYYFT